MRPPLSEDAALARAAGWRLDWLLVGVAVAAAVALGVVAVLATDVSWVERFDRWVNRTWVQAALEQPWRVDVARRLTFWGNTPVVALLTTVVVGWQLFRRRWVLAAWLAGTVVAGWLLNHTLKGLVERTRPPSDGLFLDAIGSSFPSGHAQVAGYAWTAYAVLALLLLSGRLRYLVAGGCVLVAIGIVVSRVGLAVHWPTDVVAGYAVGVGWALLSTVVLVLVARRRGSGWPPAVTASPAG